MKEELSSEMEARIIEAATRAFVKKGRAGTSMTDIAEEAGITRTSLNYYFRGKDKLFNLVFDKVIQSLLSGFLRIIHSEAHIFEKFRRIIDVYFDLLNENPLFPLFILHELTVNPELMINTFRQKGLDPAIMLVQIRKAMDNGIIKRTDPENIVVNLLGLIIFPFVAQPMLQGLLFEGDITAAEEFSTGRREYLKEYFIESIKA